MDTPSPNPSSRLGRLSLVSSTARFSKEILTLCACLGVRLDFRGSLLDGTDELIILQLIGTSCGLINSPVSSNRCDKRKSSVLELLFVWFPYLSSPIELSLHINLQLH